MATVRTVKLPAGEEVPALGLGTWHLGEDPAKRREEIAAIRTGLDLGMTLIDTAEMYVGAEDLIGEAVAGRRNECFIVDKLLPTHATRRGAVEACEKSLRRLVTDHIDPYLYLLIATGRQAAGDHDGVVGLRVGAEQELALCAPAGDQVELTRRGGMPGWLSRSWPANGYAISRGWSSAWPDTGQRVRSQGREISTDPDCP